MLSIPADELAQARAKAAEALIEEDAARIAFNLVRKHAMRAAAAASLAGGTAGLGVGGGAGAALQHSGAIGKGTQMIKGWWTGKTAAVKATAKGTVKTAIKGAATDTMGATIATWVSPWAWGKSISNWWYGAPEPTLPTPQAAPAPAAAPPPALGPASEDSGDREDREVGQEQGWVAWLWSMAGYPPE